MLDKLEVVKLVVICLYCYLHFKGRYSPYKKVLKLLKIVFVSNTLTIGWGGRQIKAEFFNYLKSGFIQYVEVWLKYGFVTGGDKTPVALAWCGFGMTPTQMLEYFLCMTMILDI
uniref:Uncharacterized protein n=1 Tax=Setaria digitata TaxID=48799 RepID=A0A915PWQ3_9BILA